MFNISSFLEKLSKNISSQQNDLQSIIDVISNKTNIVCNPNSIRIQNNTLFLNISSGAKNKIYINKQSILDSFKDKGIKIDNIR